MLQRALYQHLSHRTLHFTVRNLQKTGMNLQNVVAVLNKMAPPTLADSWDNVGLLVEPSPPHTVEKIMLTNDLTPDVMHEAVEKRVNMIISYHPPIFTALKRLTQQSWKEKLITECLERRIAVYSPHTTWDAAKDGVNSWLISAFDVTDLKPVKQHEEFLNGRSKKLTFETKQGYTSTLKEILQKIYGVTLQPENIGSTDGSGEAVNKFSMMCRESDLAAILDTLTKCGSSVSNFECFDLAKLPTVGFGMGRTGCLKTSISVTTAVSCIKSHLNLQHVRLALAADKPEISTVAVCAGSGSGVLKGVEVDLFVTGEMSHHEVLDAVCRGTHVILCDHSNTERGFLKVIQGRLQELLLSSAQILVSEKDRDPLTVV